MTSSTAGPRPVGGPVADGDALADGDYGAGGLSVYAEAVLDVVDQVPPGSVTTYGRIARALAEAGLGGGPRSVGAVMSAHGGAVAWWRVLPADGSPPVCDPDGARARWRDEGTPLRPGARGRVDLARAVVDPVAPDWVHQDAAGPPS